eukprot:6535189-Pyramimonas_sp.AAC.1
MGTVIYHSSSSSASPTPPASQRGGAEKGPSRGSTVHSSVGSAAPASAGDVAAAGCRRSRRGKQCDARPVNATTSERNAQT